MLTVATPTPVAIAQCQLLSIDLFLFHQPPGVSLRFKKQYGISNKEFRISKEIT
jgi:hypothetical protein